jgi:tRNA threonylcarbamoyladenosine biosynthesis protein TsaE
MIWQTSSTSSAETERLGGLLGKQLTGGEVIELRSDLGGGKTTFVRGLARGAGYEGDVTSPTFTLSRVYPARSIKIYHFDFYRLQEPGILTEQLAEAASDNNVLVIEWPGIVKDILPEDVISIEFKPVRSGPDDRQISIYYPEKYRPTITTIESSWQETEP